MQYDYDWWMDDESCKRYGDSMKTEMHMFINNPKVHIWWGRVEKGIKMWLRILFNIYELYNVFGNSK